MRVKICGITRKDDAVLAAKLGAWAVGFIFHPQSPRYVTPETATQIADALPDTVERVGVFVDANPADILRTREAVGLTMIQLHGEETADTARAISQVVGGRILRAVRARSAFDIAKLDGYPAEAFLIDGPRAGAKADWALARLAKRLGPVILAGGLDAGNLPAAMREVAPMGIDLSSRLETRPGEKDAEKMKELFAAVKRIEEKK
jgi:phosphoribosylanthranilate isomerase